VRQAKGIEKCQTNIEQVYKIFENVPVRDGR
jgi:hypothetical protein